MNRTCFDPLPWPCPPDDFREQNRSGRVSISAPSGRNIGAITPIDDRRRAAWPGVAAG